MAFNSWSQTAGSNTTVGGVSIAEGMSPGGVNNAIRGLMAEVATWRDLIGGKVVSAGTADAQTVTTGMSMAAYAQGILMAFEAGSGLTNTGAMTIAVDGLTAKSVKLTTGANPHAGAVTAGGIYLLAYEATSDTLLLLNPSIVIGTNVLAYDAAIQSAAGVSWVQGDIGYWSGTDTAARLAKDTNATRYLSNTGASNNPAWAQVALATGVSGDLPFANLTQGSALSVLGVTGNATADHASIAAGSDHQVFRRSGSEVAFGAVNLGQTAATTGTLIHERGGLEADVSAYDGLTRITGGATSAVTYVPSTSFTPGIAFGGGTTGITYTTQTGYYSRIGDIGIIVFSIVLSNDGSSTGAMTVTGLPLSPEVTTAAAVVVSAATGLTGAPYGFVVAGGTTMLVRQSGSTGIATNLTEANSTNTFTIAATLVFKI